MKPPNHFTLAMVRHSPVFAVVWRGYVLGAFCVRGVSRDMRREVLVRTAEVQWR